jgi:hypothetical protein
MVKRKPIPTQLCVRCGVFQAEGKPRERLRQFRTHWPNCKGVESVVFAANGAVQRVEFS